MVTYLLSLPISEPALWQWAYRHGERIRRIVGLRYLLEIEHDAGHLLHLLFLRSAVADDALFDLKRGILKYRYLVLLSGEHERPPRLGNVDSRLLIGVEEQLLYRHCLRVKTLHKLVRLVVYFLYPLIKGRVSLGDYCAVGQEPEAVALILDDPAADYRIARVYT